MRSLLLLLAAAAAAAKRPKPPPPYANASQCPHLRTEHLARFERACLQGGQDERHTGAHVGGHEQHRLLRGTYHCACCGAALFPGDARYDSASGWPTFWGTAGPGAVTLERAGLPMPGGGNRFEAACATCGARLGPVVRDGPPPTWRRYRAHSVCLHHDKGGDPLRRVWDEVRSSALIPPPSTALLTLSGARCTTSGTTPSAGPKA